MATIPDPSLVATESDGTEAVRVLKGGRWRWMMTAMLRGMRGEKGEPGGPGLAGRDGKDGAKGEAGSPKRVEVYSGAAGALTFPSAFNAPPVVLPVVTFIGAQSVIAVPSAVTRTGCTLTVMRSRGTLALSSGPFEVAPASTAGFVVAIGT